MKRKLLIIIQEFLMGFSKTPWACFETNGPTSDGRVGFSISWNEAFIKNLKSMGYEGIEEEMVQMFFVSTQMIPESMDDSDTINPEAMPNLTNEANSIRR